MILELVEEAVRNGASQQRAREVLGISVRTVQRWRRDGGEDRPRRAQGRRAMPGLVLGH